MAPRISHRYEVAWTRLLTLFLGHTTAAVSTVLAAFMGGLAIGSASGGRVASRMTRRQALQMYAALELVVIVSAIARQAVEADGSNPAAHNLLGAIYASMGQRQPARESFEAARRLNPADTSTYTNLGLLALDSGDRNTAAELFTEALILDPQSPAAREGLARAQSVR